MTTERLCAGLLDRGTEFVIAHDPILGDTTRRFGTCGPRALASAIGNWRNKAILCADVYTLMRAHNLCDPSGASTIGGLRSAAQILGASAAAYQGYVEPWPQWQAFLDAHAGYDPIVVETAEGWVFVDSISGCGENANVNPSDPNRLRYHFICVLGFHPGGYSPHAGRTLPAGYWVADGDNYAGGNDAAHSFQAANALQFYPVSVMSAARVCAALALPGLATGVPMFQAPAGWQDDGHTLTAPNGHSVVLGFRDYIGNPLNGWLPTNEPVGAQYHADPLEPGNPAIGAGDRQDFLLGSLGYTASKGVYAVWVGQDIQALTHELAAERASNATLTAQVASLNTQLGDAQATIKGLQQQVADLEAKLAAGDPQAAAAKALMTQLKATLAQF